jgi:cytosolic carboxypeptidase protein 6
MYFLKSGCVLLLLLLLFFSALYLFKTSNPNSVIIEKEIEYSVVPVQKQFKGEFRFANGVTLSNQFDGARLSGAALTNDTLITVLIAPENRPINPSPWYAFKIWSDSLQSIYLNLTYPEGITHRYHPKISSDGMHWSELNSSGTFIKLETGPDTLWIAAYKIIDSKTVRAWIDSLAQKSFVSTTKIGESHEGRDINVVKIEHENAKKNIVVLSGQHAAENAGYFAMVSFINALTAETGIARNFRNEFNIYLFPLINPDGIDNGHWRHNSGGMDLNKDWERSVQPEVNSIKNFLTELSMNSGTDFYASFDFHSTYEDIFYILNPELKSNIPGLSREISENLKPGRSHYQPIIRHRSAVEPMNRAESYFYNEYGMESLVIEIAENTPVDSIGQKGTLLAKSVMEAMLNR